ncbi:MAG: putative glycoside hydrolase [Terriglobia bacterium]
MPVENVPPPAPGEAGTQTVVHTVTRGESLPSLTRHYLSQTPYMTTGELEAAIRLANVGKIGKYLRPGDQVVIPGILLAPLVEQPAPVARDFEMRGIYLTGYMAGSEHGLQLIRQWREAGGNAVAFDIKDMDGLVDVPFEHPLAPRQKYVPIRSLPKIARFLHSLGLHAIARIALFRDERLAQDHPALAVQSRRTGQAWKENNKLVWTDPSKREVQDYNLALARMVATSGVDEIQFDYVRFPAEGDQKDARFAFESLHPDWERSDVISKFLARAYNELHPLGVLVSLDVFGVMAWQRPVDLDHTGQDIPVMARSCDVLSPMVYPSHFFGMDGYAKPGDAPEHFISESMQRFAEITAETKVVLRPWLQAFAWRTKTYSDAYIRTEVSAAREQGGVGFLFWNARNDYSKLFPAMTEMRAAPARFFRGDEIRAAHRKSPPTPAPSTPAGAK